MPTASPQGARNTGTQNGNKPPDGFLATRLLRTMRERVLRALTEDVPPPVQPRKTSASLEDLRNARAARIGL